MVGIGNGEMANTTPRLPLLKLLGADFSPRENPRNPVGENMSMVGSGTSIRRETSPTRLSGAAGLTTDCGSVQ
jgi:hypothetical protein